MAAGDVTIFDEGLLAIQQGKHIEGSHTFKLAILDDTTTPAAGDTTPALGDYTEVGAAGTYTAGGTAITLSITEAAGTVTFDFTTNPEWAADASNDTDAYWGLIYNDSLAGDDAIGFVDLGGPFDMTANTLTVTWNDSGLYTAVVS